MDVLAILSLNFVISQAGNRNTFFFPLRHSLEPLLHSPFLHSFPCSCILPVLAFRLSVSSICIIASFCGSIICPCFGISTFSTFCWVFLVCTFISFSRLFFLPTFSFFCRFFLVTTFCPFFSFFLHPCLPLLQQVFRHLHLLFRLQVLLPH